MEPNKLEKHFRDKLEQRTLKPSPMAWDRLDAMLSVAEEKKKPKKRTWMYAAASFLGFLLVGTLFLKQGNSEIKTTIKSNDVVVATPSVKSNDNTETVAAPVVETITETPANISNQPVQVAEVRQKPASTKTITAPQVKKEILPVVVQSNEVVAENIQEKPLVNDADKLLAESLSQNQRNNKRSIKVDSKSLLSSVEGELDQSFKEKAFNGAIKNFNAIKTSVANRNHR